MANLRIPQRQGFHLHDACRTGSLVVAMCLVLTLSACTGSGRQSGWLADKRAGGSGWGTPPAESSLIDKIDPGTPPQQAASLRLTEDGRKLIESGDHAKALTHLEKTLALDSSNPYVYFFLAKAHFNLAHYRQSVDFLDVAESMLDRQPYWLAEVMSLRGENFQAMGLLREASQSYAEALRLNPKNQKAAVGLTRVQRALEVPSVR